MAKEGEQIRRGLVVRKTQISEQVSVDQDARNQTRGVQGHIKMPAGTLAMTRDQELSMKQRLLQPSELDATPEKG